MNENNKDISKIRSDLMDFFGTAMFAEFPMRVIDLSNVEIASESELIEIAKQNDLS